jgi:hypothetical protein
LHDAVTGLFLGLLDESREIRLLDVIQKPGDALIHLCGIRQTFECRKEDST